MTEDELAELMAEPPCGDNHGRAKSGGAWLPLESLDWHAQLCDVHTGSPVPAPAGPDAPSMKHYVEKPRKHGTAYTYQRIRCRCLPCRAWKREDNRRRRAGEEPQEVPSLTSVRGS